MKQGIGARHGKKSANQILLDKTFEFLKEKKLDDALNELNKTQNCTQKESIRYHFARAVIFERKRQYDEAIVEYEIIKRRHPEAKPRIISLYLKLEKYFEAAKELIEDDVWLHNQYSCLQLGSAYKMMGKHDSEFDCYIQYLYSHYSKKVYDALLRSATTPEQHKKIGDLLATKKQWLLAAEAFRKARKYRLELICLLNNNQLENGWAWEACSRINALSSDVIEMCKHDINNKDYLIALNKLTDFCEILKKYDEVLPEDVVSQKIICLENLNRYEEAIAFIQNLFSDDSINSTILFENMKIKLILDKIRILTKMKNIEEARQVVDQLRSDTSKAKAEAIIEEFTDFEPAPVVDESSLMIGSLSASIEALTVSMEASSSNDAASSSAPIIPCFHASQRTEPDEEGFIPVIRNRRSSKRALR